MKNADLLGLERNNECLRSEKCLVSNMVMMKKSVGGFLKSILWHLVYLGRSSLRGMIQNGALLWSHYIINAIGASAVPRCALPNFQEMHRRLGTGYVVEFDIDSIY